MTGACGAPSGDGGELRVRAGGDDLAIVCVLAGTISPSSPHLDVGQIVDEIDEPHRDDHRQALPELGLQKHAQEARVEDRQREAIGSAARA